MTRAMLIAGCLLLLSLPHTATAQQPPPPPPPTAQTHTEAGITDSEQPPEQGEEQATPEQAQAIPSTWLSGRNPFWPIGFEPPLSISDDARRRMQLEARARWPKLQHTPPTRLPSGDMVTIVKGFGLAEAGTIIRVEQEGLVYRWRVTAIDEQGIHAKRLPLRAVRP